MTDHPANYDDCDCPGLEAHAKAMGTWPYLALPKEPYPMKTQGRSADGGLEEGDASYNTHKGDAERATEAPTRSAGGIDNADAARSEPSPVGDATTSVGPVAGL